MLVAMRITLRGVRRVDWPPLAWAARIGQDGGVTVFAGDAVKETADGLLAAAWSGPFATTSPFEALTSIGTALRLLPDRIEALCGNAGPDVLFLHRGGEGLVLANGLPIALAAAGDALLPDYPYLQPRPDGLPRRRRAGGPAAAAAARHADALLPRHRAGRARVARRAAAAARDAARPRLRRVSRHAGRGDARAVRQRRRSGAPAALRADRHDVLGV
jgi:hypothetical protein